MKTREPEYIEGQDAQRRFVGAMRSILSVSREEILRREATYKRQAALNPRKRGPKPKQKMAPYPFPGEQPHA